MQTWLHLMVLDEVRYDVQMFPSGAEWHSFIHTQMKKERLSCDNHVLHDKHADLIQLPEELYNSPSSVLIDLIWNPCITSILSVKLWSKSFDISIFNKHTFFTFNQYENTFTTTTMSISIFLIECQTKQHHDNIIIFLFFFFLNKKAWEYLKVKK